MTSKTTDPLLGAAKVLIQIIVIFAMVMIGIGIGVLFSVEHARIAAKIAEAEIGRAHV